MHILKNIFFQSLFLTLVFSSSTNASQSSLFKELFEKNQENFWCDNNGIPTENQIWKCVDIPPYRIMETYDSYKAYIIINKNDAIEIFRTQEDINGKKQENFLIKGPWEDDLFERILNKPKKQEDQSKKDKALKIYQDFYINENNNP